MQRALAMGEVCNSDAPPLALYEGYLHHLVLSLNVYGLVLSSKTIHSLMYSFE